MCFGRRSCEPMIVAFETFLPCAVMLRWVRHSGLRARADSWADFRAGFISWFWREGDHEGFLILTMHLAGRIARPYGFCLGSTGFAVDFRSLFIFFHEPCSHRTKHAAYPLHTQVAQPATHPKTVQAPTPTPDDPAFESYAAPNHPITPKPEMP